MKRRDLLAVAASTVAAPWVHAQSTAWPTTLDQARAAGRPRSDLLRLRLLISRSNLNSFFFRLLVEQIAIAFHDVKVIFPRNRLQPIRKMPS